MDGLPDEITVTILSYLSLYSDFNSARLVCRKWYQVMKTIVSSRQREFRTDILNGELAFSVENQAIKSKTHGPSPSERDRGHFDRRRFRISDGAEPKPRFSHNSCVIGRFLYIFGGCALSNSKSNAAFNDLHQFDLVDKKWERVTLNQGYLPAPRECSSMVVYDGSLVIFGGWNSPRSTEVTGMPKFFNDANIVDVSSRSCTAVQCSSIFPSARAGHSACVIGDQMVMFGGAQRMIR